MMSKFIMRTYNAKTGWIALNESEDPLSAWREIMYKFMEHYSNINHELQNVGYITRNLDNSHKIEAVISQMHELREQLYNLAREGKKEKSTSQNRYS